MKLKTIIFQQDIYMDELLELQNLMAKEINSHAMTLISRIA